MRPHFVFSIILCGRRSDLEPLIIDETGFASATLCRVVM